MYGVAAIINVQWDRLSFSTENWLRSWPRIDRPWPRSPIVAAPGITPGYS